MEIQRISAYFCPTTVLFVDDDPSYLNLLIPQLENEFPLFELYNNPDLAFNYLTRTYKANKLLELAVGDLDSDSLKTKHLSIDIQKIADVVYDRDRFSEISVLITDFNMPNQTGAELCKSLEERVSLKKLMITSQSEEKLAIDLLNRGIINQFIRKGLSKEEEHTFVRDLSDAIQDLRQDYLYKRSHLITESLLSVVDYMPPPLKNHEFINLFNQIFNDNKLCEYYLIDPSGSFLFLNSAGDLSYLLIRTEDDMRTAEELVEDSDNIQAPEMLNLIKAREKMIYWNKEEDFPLTKSSLDERLYPTNKIGSYYYCYVNDRNILNLDRTRIVAFDQYCLEKTREAG